MKLRKRNDETKVPLVKDTHIAKPKHNDRRKGKMPVTFNPETKIREFDLNDDSADDFVERLNVTPEIEMNLDEDDFLSERLRVNKPVKKSVLKKNN
ncbi:hypothetical protein HK096_000327, partial [Nowakowskiella sp. JEL0078]